MMLVVKPTQQGVAPHTGAGVPGRSAGVSSSGMVTGAERAPLASVAVIVALIVMPAGGARLALDVAVRLNLPNSAGAPTRLTIPRHVAVVIATVSTANVPTDIVT